MMISFRISVTPGAAGQYSDQTLPLVILTPVPLTLVAS